tara:strand:- start:2345 stop:2893 length:549 start_codon:yes stop_codon:yes gene_type:complete
MRKISPFILALLIIFSLVSFAHSDDKEKEINSYLSEKTMRNTELNFFTGMFDFSDDKQRAAVLGLEHQNDELFIKSTRGAIYSPITGGFVTANNAFYLYTGIQAEYKIGSLIINPSFAPGYYGEGNGKDLGYPLEFKTELQLAFDLSDSTHLGMSYNHISNASLGDKNPGANSYMFNFLKQF